MVEVDFLIDTDVLVEIFRARESAQKWFESIQKNIIGVPVLVYLEVLQGVENKNQQRLLIELMRAKLYIWSRGIPCWHRNGLNNSI